MEQKYLTYETVLDGFNEFENSEKTAVICGKERITYRELIRKAKKAARAMAAEGVKKGDRVILSILWLSGDPLCRRCLCGDRPCLAGRTAGTDPSRQRGCLDIDRGLPENPACERHIRISTLYEGGRSVCTVLYFRKYRETQGSSDSP